MTSQSNDVSRLQPVPIERDSRSFQGREAEMLEQIDKRAHQQIEQQSRDWKRNLARMRIELLELLSPDDPRCQEPVDVVKKTKRKKMLKAASAAADSEVDQGQTVILANIDMTQFDRQSVCVTVDDEQIVVTARRLVAVAVGQTPVASTAAASPVVYTRRLSKPTQLQRQQLQASLSADNILTLAAPRSALSTVTPAAAAAGDSTRQSSKQGNRKMKNLRPHPADSAPEDDVNVIEVVAVHQGQQESTGDKEETTVKQCGRAASSHDSHSSGHDAATDSPSSGTPSKEKVGVPIFRDELGTRRMYLAVELGPVFRPRDVIVQVVKENRIQIRAKHREKTTERLSKSKFIKEFELGEKIETLCSELERERERELRRAKIETFSLHGGLTAAGKLIINAYAKGHGPAGD